MSEDLNTAPSPPPALPIAGLPPSLKLWRIGRRIGGFAALVFFLAAILLAVDLLAGGITWGAHLELPALGPAPWLVDLLGMGVYFALLFIPAMIILGLGRLRHRPDRLAPGFAFPLAVIALAFIVLQVGQAIPGAKNLPALTAFMAAIIVALIFYLPRLENSARTYPGRLALAGLVFPIITRLVFAFVGRLPLGEWNREAQFGLVVILIMITLSALFYNLRAKPRWQIPGAKRFAGVIGILLIALLALWGGQKISQRPGPAAADAPNLALIVFDTLRADAISPYGGSIPTPNFADLAAKGVVFEQVQAQAPATRYSMASAFASRSAAEVHGTITEKDTTLAQLLQKQGYATGVVCANQILNPGTGILNGFSEQVVFNHHLRWRNIFSLELPGLEALLGTMVKPPAPGGLLDNGQVVMRQADKFLANQGSRPYFLWAHVMVPHDPYDPPAKFLQFAGEAPWPVFAPHDQDLGTPQVSDIRAGYEVLGPGEKAYVKYLYDGEVAYADELLGEIQKSVARASGSRKTIICVIADHGEEFWEHGDFYHGQSLYQELLHVPLIISAPGAAPGQRVKERVALMDVMPTLSELCGVPVSPTFKGRSLAERMKSGAAPLPPVAIYAEKNIYYAPIESITLDNYKLIRPSETRKPVQLYDLAADPKEQTNLAEKFPQVAQKLAAQLDARLRSMPVDEAARQKEKANLEDLKEFQYFK
jgi:arylsulfatase A-like enzyme